MHIENLQDITLIHGDCMDYMATLPDKAFKLAIVDPPYRDQIDNQPTKDMRNNGTMKCFGDRPTEEYFTELFRISENQIIWGANNFVLPPYKGFAIWKKKTISDVFTMSMCEMAYLSENLGTISKLFEYQPQDKYRIHPNQKPVALYKWLLKNYAKDGDTILDTHLGSGSSAIAAHDGHFKFTGIELDAYYYEAAKKRIINHQRQINLF